MGVGTYNRKYFFCLPVDGPISCGGGANKRGWGGAYKRQLTILYVNHDRGLFITNYNYNYQGRETLTARTISMLGSESVTTGRDAQ